jgi:hypothetical protein
MPSLATNIFRLVAICLTGLIQIGHGEEPRLPAGDAGAGLKAFIDLRCIHCHTVQGTPIDHLELGQRLDLKLAVSEPRFVKDYQDLLTAITNPRHVIQERYRQLLSPDRQAEAEPFMLDLTARMTVRQLIDLLAFLDERYAAGQSGYAPRR